MINKTRQYAKSLVVGALALGGSVVSAFAAAPTDMDGVSALGAGYISTGTTTAIAAAILGFGWVGYRIVKSYTKGALSK